MPALGTVFVELDLSKDKFERSLSTLQEQVKVTALNAERNFATLGIKSSQQFDLMRAKTENAYEAIRRSSKSTADDILRAEQAKNQKIIQLNEEQFGRQRTLLESFTQNWVAASVAIVGAWMAINKVVSIFSGMIDQYQKFAFQVRDLSYLSGGSARDVSILVTGLEDLGVEAGTVERGIAMMSKAIEAGSPVLQRLGISIRDAGGRTKTALTLFYDTIEALRGMQNEMERNAVAREIFGRGWTEMIPAIEKGVSRIKQLGEENAKLGLVMGKDGIKAAEEYTMAVNDLSDAWDAAKIRIAGGLIPTLTNLLGALARQEESVRALNADWGTYIDTLEKASAMPVPEHIRGTLPDTGARQEARRALVSADKEMAWEIERRIKLENELLKLQSQRQGFDAVTEEEKLAAAIRAVNVQREIEQHLITVALGKGERTREEAAALAQAMNAAADAQINRLNREDAIRRAKEAEAAYIKEAQAARMLMDALSDPRLQEGGPGFISPAPFLPGGSLTGGFEAVGRRGLPDELTGELNELDAMLREVEEKWAFLGEDRLLLIKEQVAREFALRVEAQSKEQAASEGLIAWMRAKYFELDDTVREHQVSSVKVTEDEVYAARVAGWNRSIELAKDSLDRMEADAEFVRDERFDAEKERLQAMRQEFIDFFGSVGSAISTSIKGVILGTQTMEDAFKNMAQNIALSLIDNIVNRGLKAVSEALLDLLWQVGSPAGQSSSLAGGLIGAVISGIFGALSGVGGGASTSGMTGADLGFQRGGIVPGPIGAPVPALVHGGEEILTPAQRKTRAEGVQITQVFAPQVGIPEAVRRELWAMMPAIRQDTMQAVIDSRYRGGSMSRAMGAKR